MVLVPTLHAALKSLYKVAVGHRAEKGDVTHAFSMTLRNPKLQSPNAKPQTPKR